jgi:heme A synthase
VTGLVLLRLIQETKDARFEDELARAFQEAGFVSDQIPAPSIFEEIRKKRTRNVLRLSSGILALSVLLSLMGMMAVLWHMAWWIAIGFCVVVLISLLLVILAIASSQLPASQEEKEQKRRNGEVLTKHRENPAYRQH